MCTKDAESIPLHSLGVVDIAATDVTQNEVLAHALINVSRSDKADGWAIKRSGDFVNEYPRKNSEGGLFDGSCENPNHLLGSFPCLFPYGQGGFEVDRRFPVPYKAHARWALRYDDKRFRLDLHFVFQLFGVLQKRELCASAALQISKPAFSRYEHAIRSLTTCDFESAGAEEQAQKTFSNPIMSALRRNLTAVRAKVMGTDESRIKIRSLIWGMSIHKNPPSIWLTINPADTQDPIAQVLCGKDIDLNNFDALHLHPSDTAIASDPYASAQFFHLTINAVLESLLGISACNHNTPIKREKGILGVVDAYIGTVEAQGRGTLHLHIVLWLQGSVPTQQMKELLLTEDFRNKMKAFIGANIRADLPDTPGSAVTTIPQQSSVAFSRPVDPRLPHYEKKRDEAERRIARTVQVHQCGQPCLKVVKSRLVCKCRAPFPLAVDNWVDEHGNWGPRRTYSYFNNWCPPILQSVRANHNIKLITNGTETKDIAWYITHYVAKKQKQSYNTSALLAQTFAYHEYDEKRSTDLTATNKQLIQRCGNTLSRQQELSAPEVISYLMGWGDRFVSHHFETIHWYSVDALLKKQFPVLNRKR